MNLNKVIIVGRLTKDPEKRTIPSGLSVASFGVATNSYYKDKSGNSNEKVEFHNVVLFGNLADTASTYLKKGSLALFEGRLQTSKWDDKDGNTRYRTEIIAEKMQLGPKSDGGSNYNSNSTPQKNDNNKQEDNYKEKEIPVVDEDEIDVRDIPF